MITAPALSARVRKSVTLWKELDQKGAYVPKRMGKLIWSKASYSNVFTWENRQVIGETMTNQFILTGPSIQLSEDLQNLLSQNFPIWNYQHKEIDHLHFTSGGSVQSILKRGLTYSSRRYLKAIKEKLSCFKQSFSDALKGFSSGSSYPSSFLPLLTWVVPSLKSQLCSRSLDVLASCCSSLVMLYCALVWGALGSSLASEVSSFKRLEPLADYSEPLPTHVMGLFPLLPMSWFQHDSVTSLIVRFTLTWSSGWSPIIL